MSHREILTAEDALLLGYLRNSCREYMTRNQTEIRAESQLEFWDSRPATWKGWVFSREASPPVGFGYVTPRDRDSWWVTGGVLSPFRKVGLGREIFEFLTSWIQDHGGDAWLEVLQRNTVAIHLYKSLGYSEVSRDDHLIIMRKAGQL